MKKRIFYGMLIVSSITLLACATLIMGVLNDYFSIRLNNELAEQANNTAKAVETGGIEYLQALKTADYSRTGKKHITWIDSDGTVIFDTSEQADLTENNAQREEFQQALENGSGQSSRYSDALAEKTTYYAVLLTDGTVIRLADTRYTSWTLAITMAQPLAIIIFTALILSSVLSYSISRRVVRPINQIDLNNPDLDEKYEEFAPLLNKLAVQNKTIEQQIKQLKKQQEEFKTITENMSEGFLVVNQQAGLLSYNTAALNLLGAEMAKEEKVSVLALNRSEKFRLAVDEALNGRHSIGTLQINNRCCQIIANPVKEEGEMFGAVIVLIDVTEKEQREQLRREFTANISHELKTPLTSIYGMSELITNDNMDHTDIIDFAGSIHDEAGRLINLVNDILKLSQLDEGVIIDKAKEAIDLFELAAEVIKRLRNSAAANHVVFELSGEHAFIVGIRDIVEEMIFNICENAVKYNKPNGRVTVSILSSGEHVKLIVKDTGIGIAKEHLNRVFERFYRADKSHSKKIGGTGLGLSIVKHGAVCHNADIFIDSTVDEGTAVTILF